MTDTQAIASTPAMDSDDDYARRFAGVGRVYGDAALTRFAESHAVVVGLGDDGRGIAIGLVVRRRLVAPEQVGRNRIDGAGHVERWLPAAGA